MRYSILLLLAICACSHSERKIFDVHLHGEADATKQFENLRAHGVYVAAVSTSWKEQQKAKGLTDIKLLQGLFVPCPLGKVPYSQQQKTCYENGNEWPELAWVEQQLQTKQIDFLGEVLTQYYGISSSDTLMYPYYALAEKYNVPVGIHTGSAGPDHGCPNFKEEMGNPSLLHAALKKFPKLRVWLMHGGAPFVGDFLQMMKTYPNLYADISVLNNPNIIPSSEFATLMKLYIDGGLEDRLMFGTDNADIKTTVQAVEELEFLSAEQKEKIFFRNAETFFHGATAGK